MLASILLNLNPLAKIGYVGKDYEELIFVGLTLAFSMGAMVLFGMWWSR
jgi:hypothetical protein